MSGSDSDLATGESSSDHSTSATSERSASKVNIIDRSTSYDDDKLAFFDDIRNYIPLGCLVYDADEYVVDKTNYISKTWNEYKSDHLTSTPQLSRLVSTGRLRIYGRQSDERCHHILRLYYMPNDVGRRFDCQLGQKILYLLGDLFSRLRVDLSCWNGSYNKANENNHAKFDPFATATDQSLFYLFNTLPSPKPDLDNVQDHESRIAMGDVLFSNTLAGMRTSLYPYQQRTIGLMLERESTVCLKLDPRLDCRCGPTGEVFYFDSRCLSILKHPRYFETAKGGMLAETMGLGKTLITLGLILATKNHQPKIPPLAMRDHIPMRPHVGTLADMAVSAITHHAVPWKARFSRYQESTGEDMSSCMRRLELSPTMYKLPSYRSVRNTRFGSAEAYALRYENKTLCGTTIVVVPLNILSQWHLELEKHFDEEAFKVLTLDKLGQVIPPAAELMEYDIILFSKGRFEKEVSDGCANGERIVDCGEPNICSCSPIEEGITRNVICDCVRQKEIYISPLRHLHWLRIIVDEGHNYSSSLSNAVLVADKLITAERRWIVTGTPLKNIISVEVDAGILAGNEATPEAGAITLRKKVLDQRRSFSLSEDKKAIQSLGILAANFLKAQPWTSSENGKCAEWIDYAYRHESLRRHTYSGLSLCLQKSLESLVIKTRPEDVERDIVLPPLTHKIVRLQPSFYDKLTANSFNLVLTANAVTSERADVDYLFHKNSGRMRSQLVLNLRQSNFFWTGFSESDILSAINHGENYLKRSGTKCTEEDRCLLNEALLHGKKVLHQGWKAQSTLHEPGIYLENWPLGSSNYWDLEAKRTSPVVVGEAQLLRAQLHVNSQLNEKDPFVGLAEAASSRTVEGQPNQQQAESILNEGTDTITKMGVPLSVFNAEGHVTRKELSCNKKYSIKRNICRNANTQCSSANTSLPNKAYKRKFSMMLDHEVPEESQLRKTEIVGTASSKLSYIIDQIMEYQETEKILIFYDFENSAFYLAQALELLDVKHHIYAKSLSNELRSKYISDFLHDDGIRVMLLDIRCAALGLNINVANRVIFINPVCKPNIEAQAIKRAHRIGQTKPVIVETLLLAGTIEEAMFERARKMTRQEHQDAAKALEDDRGIANIIQKAKPLPIDSVEQYDRYEQMAKLKMPQMLFARPNRGAARFTSATTRKVAAS